MLKQPWMKKGGRVKLSTGPGIITTVVEAKTDMGAEVLHLNVQPEGVKQSFPYSPQDVDEWPPVKLMVAGQAV